MINIWRIAYSHSLIVLNMVFLKVDFIWNSLNETLIALHSILPKFQKGEQDSESSDYYSD